MTVTAARAFARSFIAAAVLAICPSLANAYLGSFTANDGYFPGYGTMFGEVSYYNAGQNGVNAGGGPSMQVAADSGLWKLQSNVGGVFGNPVDRANYVSVGPGSYPATDANGVPAYILGGHFPGRTLDNANLALRNDTPLGTGTMVYDYHIDSYDFGGVNPATVTSGPVVVEFYFCPNPGDSNGSGAAAPDKFALSFRDNAGNTGLEWGYQRDNAVVWRKNPTDPWNSTAFIADATNWDGVRVNIDLTADTFSLDYFDISANAWSNVVAAGTNLGTPLADLRVLRWSLVDGLNSGNGGKNYFDDFGFQVQVVPEPASLAIVGAAAVMGLVWRRRK